ncbi:MAG TPA: class I SAM-dependent methyltransferase [Dongiaceae bacterium]|nr:class I SAM-dependent methyltransferase [Dongiaceae bacterium]
MAHLIRRAANLAFRLLMPEAFKERHELSYWRKRYQEEHGQLRNQHYERYYTTFFGLNREFYRSKRIIDIGCGPRGSLEWADMAAERVGLDSLAKEYMKLGADKHKMTYVDSGAESIPFPTAHFDAVFSFNSLDHVRDLTKVIAEIKRIVKPGGLFLLITEIGHEPTATEPQSFSFETVDRFTPAFVPVWSQAYEIERSQVYQSIDAGIIYDRSNPVRRPALLCVKFERQMQV